MLSRLFRRLFLDKLVAAHQQLQFFGNHLPLADAHAFATYLAGRLGSLWDQLGARTSDENHEVLLKSLAKRPIAYFQMFYGDTVVGGFTPALRCGVDFFGADRVLFASDSLRSEGGPMFIRENMRAVEELGLSPDDQQRIFSRNAIEMFRLP